jgi:NAD(P)-dependent dehydrogenase (short-subunit alcohol dehydrogenase family)
VVLTQANPVLRKPLQYNASKAGVLQLAKSLAVEWVDFCRVNCVSPGYIQTQIMEYASQEMLDKWRNQIPARRFASPYELKGVGVQSNPLTIDTR